jgi:hypothetical protein
VLALLVSALLEVDDSVQPDFSRQLRLLANARRGGQDMNQMTLFVVLFAASSLMAQSGPGRSSGGNKRHSKKPEVTVQGCLGIDKGDYVLMQTDRSNLYELVESHEIKLSPHLGEQVEVAGRETPTLSTSSDTFVSGRGVSAVTIEVESIKMLAQQCTVREINADQEAAPVSGAQLQISSLPADADIEIDGNFVGNTPSTVGLAGGQHQLVVKKSGYKPWEKKIAVSSGEVKVNAVLEAESK